MTELKMSKTCNCILCFPDQDISKELPSSPTIYCRNLNYWNNMLTRCCCTKHSNCLKSKIVTCKCPKCCLHENDDCDICSKKTYLYYICLHQENGIEDKDCENFVNLIEN